MLTPLTMYLLQRDSMESIDSTTSIATQHTKQPSGKLVKLVINGCEYHMGFSKGEVFSLHSNCKNYTKLIR